jgi:pimeloyl-ACP methyl ester carboxylesterase
VSSIVLVHGAGSGPWVFEGWARDLPGRRVEAVDLQRGLDVARATIGDYATTVVQAAERLPRPLALVGWSLGGLTCLVAAGRVRPEALVLLEASPPLELQGLRDDVVPRPGTFDPVLAGGRFPPGMRSRPESALAMGQRDRGVSVPALPEGTRTLVVYGDEFRHDRGPALAGFYGAEQLDAGAATHWVLVRVPALRRRVLGWIDEVLGER